MKYSLLFYENPSEFERRENAEAGEYWGAWSSYIDLLADENVLIRGNGAGLLGPQTATTLRGDLIQDGPMADTKEQLGGVLLIEVPSLDDAIKWAKRAPCIGNGAVEIRPVLPDPS